MVVVTVVGRVVDVPAALEMMDLGRPDLLGVGSLILRRTPYAHPGCTREPGQAPRPLEAYGGYTAIRRRVVVDVIDPRHPWIPAGEKRIGECAGRCRRRCSQGRQRQHSGHPGNYQLAS